MNREIVAMWPGNSSYSSGASLCGSLGIALALTMVIWIYIDGTAGGYLFDDYTSAMSVGVLQDHPDRFWAVIFSETSGLLGRPVSMLTFALEQLFLDGTPASSKRVSIGLHAFNGLLVFWLAFLMIRDRLPAYAFLIAAMVSAIWMLAPQKVSSVLYITQRMAMLSTTFILLALCSYYCARAQAAPKVMLAWAALTVAAVLLAPFAKENGILAIPLILILEVLWLSDRPGSPKYWRLGRNVALGLLYLGMAAFVLAMLADVRNFSNGYAARQFSFAERLLTQPWVLWDYTRQFFWPQITRMGVIQDDVPVLSTLAAAWLPVCGVVVLIASGLLIASGRVLPALMPLAFCVLFFFIAHSLESSFLPLEIYFEHRNYLPSLALALLPALILVGAVKRLGSRVTAPATLWTVMALSVYCGLTSMLVQVWSNNTMLRAYTVNGHPESVRALQDYAIVLARAGDPVSANALANRVKGASAQHKASTAMADGDIRLFKIALACLANTAPSADLVAEFGIEDSSEPLKYIVPRLLVSNIYDGYCPDFDWNPLIDKLQEVYFQLDGHATADYTVHKHLASFASAVGRFDVAANFAEAGLQGAPADGTMMLMLMYFYLAQESYLEALELWPRIEELRIAGGLSETDNITFSNYPLELLQQAISENP